jgi:hypothetical protein
VLAYVPAGHAVQVEAPAANVVSHIGTTSPQTTEPHSLHLTSFFKTSYTSLSVTSMKHFNLQSEITIYRGHPEHSPVTAQAALQPDRFMPHRPDCHSISMMPVLEKTGPGIEEPECCNSSVVVEQSLVVQLLTVTVSMLQL